MTRPPVDQSDEAFDAAFRGLGGIEPPEAVSTRTLMAVAAAREAEAGRRGVPTARPRIVRAWLGGFAGLAAAAAGAWVLLPPPTPIGDPATMVPRGVAEPAALVVDLKLAVRRTDGSVERYTDGMRYHAGDTLLFRVSLPRAVNVRLLRDDALLWSGDRPEGEGELPVGYALESGESAADFVLVATPAENNASAPPGATLRVHVAEVAP